MLEDQGLDHMFKPRTKALCVVEHNAGLNCRFEDGHVQPIENLTLLHAIFWSPSWTAVVSVFFLIILLGYVYSREST